ncbi:hypothetical protein JVT61DRAFT_9944 [Boletus reticuloceps]|uniref:Uncharacterized protein n=1 Tax=Boletus reticuloceps TaxID=495285 RepID=A0A8I2YFU0_9AGAM|nr:hypothetical protein JVT61DRAFT_9944 [Boletus reticuloceps]
MNEAIHRTRSIDAMKLRSYIGQYVALDLHEAALNPPIINITGREVMDLKHPVFMYFICPADRLKEFIENPEE